MTNHLLQNWLYETLLAPMCLFSCTCVYICISIYVYIYIYMHMCCASICVFYTCLCNRVSGDQQKQKLTAWYFYVIFVVSAFISLYGCPSDGYKITITITITITVTVTVTFTITITNIIIIIIITTTTTIITSTTTTVTTLRSPSIWR